MKHGNHDDNGTLNADEITIPVPVLSPEEQWLLGVWRSTDERGRRLIRAAAESSEGWIEGSRLRVIGG